MYVVDNLGNAWGSIYNTLVNILLQNVLKLLNTFIFVCCKLKILIMLLQATVREYGQDRLEAVVKSLELLDMRFDQLKSDLNLHKVRWIVL